MKFSVRIKDTNSDMLHFRNLDATSLCHSPRLAKQKPTVDDSDLLCNLQANILTKLEVKQEPLIF